MKALLAVAAIAALGAGLWWAQRGDAPVVAAVYSGATPQPALPAPAASLPAGAVSAAQPGLAPAGGASGPAALAAAPPGERLRALVKCHAANSCHVSSHEGLDEHFEVVAAVLQQLDRLAAQGNVAEQTAWARELLAFPDGHVQAAALALAARLPPSAETVAAAVQALGKTYDAVLLAKAYPVLRQWQQLGLSAGYDEMLAGLVHTGGWQAAQSVAENLGPFLNAGNVGRFEQLARQLPAGARQQALLRTLRDYQLQQTGG
jgi:hypothetical protein